MGAENSMKKLKRKKNTKKNEEDLDMGISQLPQKEGNSYRASQGEKKNKKKKKKLSPDNKADAELFEPHSMKDETLEISGGKKTTKKTRDNKIKKSGIARTGIEEFDAGRIGKVEDKTSDGECAQIVQAEDKFGKSRKKKRKNVENVNKVDECSEKDGASEQQNGKSLKPRKMKKKKQSVANDLSSDRFLEKTGEQKVGDEAEDEVYQMSSGDEDCSKGMQKWITEHYQSRPGVKVLQERIDDFIIAHEAKEERARAERDAQAAEGGWTVVIQQKGRKKTTDAESGIAVGSVAQAAVVDKMEKKKKKDVGLDFYRFQKREAHRNEVMMLQSKFEQDKKRIQQMRAARKFRPY